MNLIMIDLSRSFSSYAWLLMAFEIILGPFFVHHIVIHPILNLSLNFSQNSLNIVWILAKNESEFSLILCILSLISVVGGLSLIVSDEVFKE